MDERGYCTCSKRDACDNAGKHPARHLPAEPGAPYGILTGASGPNGSGVFVLDCDVKPTKNGLAEFMRLCAEHDYEPDTFVVATGGGGYHFFFAHPGFPVKCSNSELAPGIDIKGDPNSSAGFAFVVGPGSPHVSGKPYKIVRCGVGCSCDVANTGVLCMDVTIAHAPAWLLDWPGLRKDAINSDVGSVEDFAFAPKPIDVTTEEGLRRMEAFRAECAGECGNLSPSISGENGHNALLKAASRGAWFYQLPPEVAVEILDGWFNPRCVPEWPIEDIVRKVREALRTAREPSFGPAPPNFGQRASARAIAGEFAPSSDGEDDGQQLIAPRKSDPDHRYAFAVGDAPPTGKLSGISVSELTFRLRRSPEWIGVLQWDLFADVIRAVNPPIPLDAENGPLTDRDITAIQAWFEVVQDTKVEPAVLRACVEAVAKGCTVHPVRDYLYGLSMGSPSSVFPNLARTWFGTEDPLDAILLEKFLVAAVRRILRPGTQVDTMLVLYSGTQGFGKTQWVRTMFGPEWSSQQMPDMHTKDASHQIATVWGQEIGELDKLLRVDPSTSKDYISRSVDTYRKPYGRDVISKPRQCVFIGTTNEIDFLRDSTGERRYWPITVCKRIDQRLVAAMRDAVWAAALALALDDEYEHWINPGSELDLALKARQVGHTQEDAWHAAILDYCCGREFVRPDDVFKVAIMNNASEWIQSWDRRAQLRIGDTLRHLGAYKSTHRDDRGVVLKGFRLPDSFRNLTPSAKEVSRRKLQEGGGPRLVTAPAAGAVAP